MLAFICPYSLPCCMCVALLEAAEIPVLDMHFKLDGELSSFDEAVFSSN